MSKGKQAAPGGLPFAERLQGVQAAFAARKAEGGASIPPRNHTLLPATGRAFRSTPMPSNAYSKVDIDAVADLVARGRYSDTTSRRREREEGELSASEEEEDGGGSQPSETGEGRPTPDDAQMESASDSLAEEDANDESRGGVQERDAVHGGSVPTGETAQSHLAAVAGQLAALDLSTDQRILSRHDTIARLLVSHVAPRLNTLSRSNSNVHDVVQRMHAVLHEMDPPVVDRRFRSSPSPPPDLITLYGQLHPLMKELELACRMASVNSADRARDMLRTMSERLPDLF